MARRAARAGTGIHRCPPSFFLFSLTVSRGLDRLDSATRPQSVAFRCGQEAESGLVPVSTEGLPPWPASHTGWGCGCFAASLPRCLAASPPFRSLFRFEYSVVAADNWRGVCSLFAVRSLFAASLLRCFAVSLPRCLAASLFRCLAASLPRCLAASPHPHPIFHNCLSTAYWTLCNG